MRPRQLYYICKVQCKPSHHARSFPYNQTPHLTILYNTVLTCAMLQHNLILPITLLFIGGANAQAAGLPVRNITGQNPWINLPAKLPKYARTLPKNLLGLSIEMDQWPQWAGTALGSPNKFVNTVLDNIASRTGYAVNLRVGGTSHL